MRPAKAQKHSKVSQLPRVEIEWEDACREMDFDGDPELLTDAGVCLNRTIGYLLRLNKREVRLATDATDADNTVRWPYAIPRKMVKKITYLIVKETDAD